MRTRSTTIKGNGQRFTCSRVKRNMWTDGNIKWITALQYTSIAHKLIKGSTELHSAVTVYMCTLFNKNQVLNIFQKWNGQWSKHTATTIIPISHYLLVLEHVAFNYLPLITVIYGRRLLRKNTSLSIKEDTSMSPLTQTNTWINVDVTRSQKWRMYFTWTSTVTGRQVGRVKVKYVSWSSDAGRFFLNSHVVLAWIPI